MDGFSFNAELLELLELESQVESTQTHSSQSECG